MKLIFPGGEHATVELATKVMRVGSGEGCDLRLAAAGVAAHHCDLVMSDGKARVRVVDAAAPTVLNGRQVEGEATLAAGDLLLFGRVGCSVVASDAQTLRRSRPAPPPTDPEEATDGRTVVRSTVPRFVLRGVSGPTLGKTFTVTRSMVIGRQPDCEIPIASAEVSRQHVRLKPTPIGVHVEDLGSSNGTWINDKRVQSELLKPGDELRLDTIRFVLVAPGMDAHQQAARVQPPPPPVAPAGGEMKRSPWLLIAFVLVLIALGAAALYLSGAL